jgi:hypothetical protein
MNISLQRYSLRLPSLLSFEIVGLDDHILEHEPQIRDDFQHLIRFLLCQI